MTTRFILMLLALMWSAFAAAGEVVNEPEQSSSWLPANAAINTNNQHTQKNIDTQTPANAKKDPANKNKRSQLGGMFDLLLPSRLRDNH